MDKIQAFWIRLAKRDSEEALRHALEENKQLLSAISSILIGISIKDQITHWNETAEIVFGIAAVQTIGKSIFECDIKWDWERIKDGIATCLENSKKTRLDDIRFIRKDGSPGELGITLTPILGKENQKAGLLLVGSDISERKMMERQLLQAQKLKSIGELATGIAHEINTPTQYVGSNIRFLQAQIGSILGIWQKLNPMIKTMKQGKIKPEMISSLEAIMQEADFDYLINEIPLALQQSLEGIDHITEIVSAMKEFSHPGYGEKTLTDINHIIENTILVARNEWKYIAELEVILDPDLPLVQAFSGELKQAILNLLVNAADAIADVVGDGSHGKGKIEVSTRLDRDWVEIRVKDDGIGMPDEIQDFVFDPFFTTKDVGKGSGQGLSITYNIIVERHGGSIDFISEYCKGTTFIIRLPVTPVEAIDQK
jgi:two-component system NtrC family sensor kinase